MNAAKLILSNGELVEYAKGTADHVIYTDGQKLEIKPQMDGSGYITTNTGDLYIVGTIERHGKNDLWLYADNAEDYETLKESIKDIISGEFPHQAISYHCYMGYTFSLIDGYDIQVWDEDNKAMPREFNIDTPVQEIKDYIDDLIQNTPIANNKIS